MHLASMHVALRAALAGTCSMVAQATPPTDSYFITRPMPDLGGNMDMTLDMVQYTSTAVQPRDTHAHVNGHLLKLKNPRGHLSVVPPLPGGCGSLQFVDETTKLYERDCKIALNAGYFDLHQENLFGCIGNIVSDGKVLFTQPMNSTNVNFGFMKNGSYVIGYISPEDVAKGEFLQLVAGLGWIVHNGKNNVAQAWSEAYTGAASTGDAYLQMTTGRTGIGYDKDGGLIILQYDGRTRTPAWGSTILELADEMIKFGAVEAINLDGGGSTQMWKDGVEIGYSSDVFQYGVMIGQYHREGRPGGDCQIGTGKGNVSSYQCTRAVSTILCLHDEDDTTIPSALPVQAAGISSAWSFLVIGLVAGAGTALVAVKLLNKKKYAPCLESEPMRSSQEEESEDA